MLLKNEDTNWRGIKQESSIEQMNRIKELVKKKENAVKDTKYELDVLKRELIRVYSDNIFYIYAKSCRGAYKWISMKDKVDKRKKYEEKDSFEVLKGWLERDLGREVTITNVCEYNYGEGWNVYFEAVGHNWSIEIPEVKNVGVKAAEYDWGVEFSFSLRLCNCDKPNVISVIGQTFNEEDLKGIMDKYLSEKEVEE